MDKNSTIISVAKDFKDFAITDNCVFEEFHVYIDGTLKYIVALYQDGDIWANDEVWGTYIVDIESETEDGMYSVQWRDFYVGDAALHVKCSYILNNDFNEDFKINCINKNKLIYNI